MVFHRQGKDKGNASLVTIDPMGGKPPEVVERITLILERILENWR